MSRLLLIVDDEPIWSAAVAAFLRRHGFRTASAADGLDAIARASAERPDLILLDLAMPRMDGLAFLRALRAVDALARVPVIVVTARAGPGVAGQTAALGVRRHFVKAGHSMQELLDAIRESLPPDASSSSSSPLT